MKKEAPVLQELIWFHTLDIYIGLVGTGINLLLFYVFLSKRSFLRKNKMLVVLACGDFCACLGTFLLGTTRKAIFQAEFEGRERQTQTSWTCSHYAFVWFRLLGAVVPSASVFWIGIERLLAVCCPIFFRAHLAKKTTRPCYAVLAWSALVCIGALSLVYKRRDYAVPYYCGRKATFSHTFSTLIYAHAISGYTAALFMNVAALLGLKRMQSKMRNKEVTKQARILRYMVLISLISTMAVVGPNMLSVFGAFYGRVDIVISEAASWLVALKSSANFFIYFVLKPDFRHRVLRMMRIMPDSARSTLESPNGTLIHSVQENNNADLLTRALIGSDKQKMRNNSLSAY